MSLTDLIKAGGVYHGIGGDTPRDALASLVEALRLNEAISKEALLKAVLEREELMPTAQGHGIALPHPRNPLTESGHEFAAIGYLKQNVDWHSLDGSPVHTVILIVSSSAKNHLRALSTINFFCQQPSFRALLKNRVPQEQLFEIIRETENEWSPRGF